MSLTTGTMIGRYSAVVEQYRVTADGSRFLFCAPLTSVQQEPLRVVLNRTERLPR